MLFLPSATMARTEEKDEETPMLESRKTPTRRGSSVLQRGCWYVGGFVTGVAIAYLVNLLATVTGRVNEKYMSWSPVGEHPWKARSGRHSILLELNAKEIRAVSDFVVKELTVDGLPTVSSLSGEDLSSVNFLTGPSAIELLPPKKEDAMMFVSMAQDSPPPRYAKVVVGRPTKFDVMEYKVGPVDHILAGKHATIAALLEDGTIPFAKRPYDVGEDLYASLVVETLETLKEVLIPSFGAGPFQRARGGSGLLPSLGMFLNDNATAWDGAEDDDDDDLFPGAVFPFAFNDVASSAKKRISTIRFFLYPSVEHFQTMWLHPLPLSFRIEHTSVNPAEWAPAYDISFCGTTYASSTELLRAYRADPSVGCEMKLDSKAGKVGNWDLPGPTCGPGNAKKEPRQDLPPQKESFFSNDDDENGQVIDWLGWKFAATVRPSTGLAILDVRFKGERIAYELALSEAAAMYTGTGADQVFYLDSGYSLSQLTGDLVEGIDCPDHAQILEYPSWVWIDPRTYDLRSNPSEAVPIRGACIFEDEEDETLWRHTQLIPGFVADGVPAKNLNVRAITAVGNYDYVTQISFRQDGAIVVSMKFAGFMETRSAEIKFKFRYSAT